MNPQRGSDSLRCNLCCKLALSARHDVQHHSGCLALLNRRARQMSHRERVLEAELRVVDGVLLSIVGALKVHVAQT